MLLNFRLLCHLQCIVDFYPEISHSAFDFCVAKQQLNSPEIFGPAIDQRRFRPAKGMRAILGRGQTYHFNPGINYSGILPRSNVF
jgi:hypothetical protein